jgi:hypothetical protein
MNRELLKADLQMIIDNRKKMLAKNAIKQKERVQLFGVRSELLDLSATLLQSEIDRNELFIRAIDAGRYDL